MRIHWDASGERKYEIGVSKGVLYVKKDTDPYGLGVPWNGLTNVAESPEGAELNDMWADGMKYASIRSAESYKTTLEAYTYPDEFAECDGFGEPVAGLQVSQQKRSVFGLCYRSEVGDDMNEAGDGDYKLHLIYGASAAPSERTHATINDSPDVEAMSWEISTTPVEVPNFKPSACLTIESAKFTGENAALLTALEGILYGKDAVGSEGSEGYIAAVDPRLPMPAEVITLLTPAA